jgi:hypothetical protein
LSRLKSEERNKKIRIIKLKKMKKKRIYLLAAVLLVAVNCAFVNAQVVIGSTTQAPNAASILDLSKLGDAQNTSLGLLLPNVPLANDTVVLSGGNEEGLLVYCPGGGGNLPKGLYIWNGTKWITVIAA